MIARAAASCVREGAAQAVQKEAIAGRSAPGLGRSRVHNVNNSSAGVLTATPVSERALAFTTAYSRAEDRAEWPGGDAIPDQGC